MTGPGSDDFEKAASDSRDVGFLGELWGFLKSTRKWWLLPIVIVIVLFGLLVFLSGTGVAPFIYTLF
jgi:uncharacterized protein DUF5989